MADSKTKIKDFFNSITNPSGSAPFKINVPARTQPMPTTLGGFFRAPSAPAPTTPQMSMLPPQMSMVPKGPVAPTVAPVRQPASAPAPFATSAPLFTPPAASAPAAPAAPVASAVPSQWMKPGGGMYTPEEVAANIEKTVLAAHGQGDVAKFAGDQFSGKEKSAVDLQGEAARINNTRNDIAVGATDPYKVASSSGVAYSPAELKAIENAYAGIYEPALDTALAKLEAKKEQDSAAAEAKRRQDELRLGAELDASAPYTLGKDQVRYDGQGNPIAVGISDNDTTVGNYVAGSNPTVDAFISGIRAGTYKASDIPDEYKAAVAQGMAASRPAISDSALSAVSVINELLGQDKLSKISGIPGVSSFFSGTQAQTPLTLSKQLKGILSLENREQLKGSGAISDFEFKVLGEAASALGIKENGKSSLSDEEFENQLEKLKLKLEVGETTLTDDELLHLQEQGYSPEEIRKAGQTSFNTVGNTTASTKGQGNVPQRNKNPGNVKEGGLADSLAIGKDSQGHLIFPDAITGFKALTMDLTAKVNGGSRYLPKNPTIAQLGKVYAEDPNWPIAVARFLGVNPNTPTQDVPITSLAQAIAKQEGFYA